MLRSSQRVFAESYIAGTLLRPKERRAFAPSGRLLLHRRARPATRFHLLILLSHLSLTLHRQCFQAPFACLPLLDFLHVTVLGSAVWLLDLKAASAVTHHWSVYASAQPRRVFVEATRRAARQRYAAKVERNDALQNSVFEVLAYRLVFESRVSVSEQLLSANLFHTLRPRQVSTRFDLCSSSTYFCYCAALRHYRCRARWFCFASLCGLEACFAHYFQTLSILRTVVQAVR